MIEVAGQRLLAGAGCLATEGQVERIRIAEPGGGLRVELPLAVRAIAGGAVVLAAPRPAVTGARAAFLPGVRIGVVRSEPGAKA